MKTMKKISAIVIALVMLFAMTSIAFAANDGKITISNPVKDHKYTIYQMVSLESFSGANFSYKVTDAQWKTFLSSKTELVEIDESNFVTWIGGTEDATIAAFAKEALQYAKNNNLTGTQLAATEANLTEGALVFDELPLGWYLVDSSLGTFCSLNTTAKEVEIEEKNEVPTLDKQVQEDSNLNWDKVNDAEIGQTVEFKLTVTAQKGAANYVIHDTLSEGLTLNADSFEIAGLTESTDYTVKTTGLEDNCSFEIVFTQNYLDTITEETEIVVTYDAILNDDAKISTQVNPNTAKLTYGEDVTSETTPVVTETKTFKFDLVKTDSSNKVLEGATFSLFTKDDLVNPIKLVEDGDMLRLATAAEIADTEIEKITQFTAGFVTIAGLDTDTYYLKEISAPEGYNKIDGEIEVKIEGANLDAVVTEEGVYSSGGIKVENLTGTELPSTGGIGTTIFYVVGALLVAGALIVLVTKRRMNSAA